MVARLREGIPGLRAVYRYGSAGSVFERPDSDIDMAVLADRPLDFSALAALAAELSLLAGREVDLNDMRRLPVTLRVQIVTGGERLYAADVAAAEEYDSRVLSDYAYLNELRQGILDDVRARGSIHG
jgi:predicted nucleotidyltransferase